MANSVPTPDAPDVTAPPTDEAEAALVRRTGHQRACAWHGGGACPCRTPFVGEEPHG